MKYTKWQQKYIDLMKGDVHNFAIEIIGELEKGLHAKEDLLVCYRLNKKPSEKIFSALEKFDKFDNE